MSLQRMLTQSELLEVVRAMTAEQARLRDAAEAQQRAADQVIRMCRAALVQCANRSESFPSEVRVLMEQAISAANACCAKSTGGMPMVASDQPRSPRPLDASAP